MKFVTYIFITIVLIFIYKLYFNLNVIEITELKMNPFNLLYEIIVVYNKVVYLIIWLQKDLFYLLIALFYL